MRLGRAQLDRLPQTIGRPTYDRARVTPGIVHLGLGAFHRAHQAVVIDERYHSTVFLRPSSNETIGV